MSSASSFSGLKFAKGKTRKQTKAQIKRQENKWIQDTRNEVLARDKVCRKCGSALRLHMHEIVYRSATRGRSIEERINTGNCVMLCEQHHREIHDKTLKITAKNHAKGADGRLEFIEL